MVYSFYFMVYLKLGLEGYATCMIFYELLNLVCSSGFYYYAVNPRAKDTKIPMKDNFCWYFKECLKNTIASCYNWIAGELVLVIITLTKDTF